MPENALSILAAAVASFVLSALYRRALEAHGTALRAWPLLIVFLAELFMALVLAGVIAHVAKHGVTIRAGMLTAVICWAGFVATTIAANNAFGRAKLAATVIDAGHWLGVLLLQGFVLGLLG